MNRFVIASALALLCLAACKKDEAAATAPVATPDAVKPVEAAKPADPGGTQVADFPVSVELPAGAIANDPSGSPGFHSEDGSISVLIGKQAPDAAQDLEAAKRSIEEFAFKKWVKSEKSADGWTLTWVGMGMDMDGKEYDTHSYEIVKKIGDDAWRCSGSVKQLSQVDANLKLCGTLKASAR